MTCSECRDSTEGVPTRYECEECGKVLYIKPLGCICRTEAADDLGLPCPVHPDVMHLGLKVRRITVVRTGGGVDCISFETDCPTPYPELDAPAPGNYPAFFQISTRHGYAEEYLELLGFEPNDWRLIDTDAERGKLAP